MYNKHNIQHLARHSKHRCCRKKAALQKVMRKTGRLTHGIRNLEVQQIFDIRHIAFGNEGRLSQAATASRTFAHENMTMECAFALDFAGAGNAKAFFRGTIGLHLWHDDKTKSMKES